MTGVLGIVLAALLAAAAPVLAQKPPPPAPLPSGEFRGVYSTIDLQPTRRMVQRLRVPYGSDRRAAIREVMADGDNHAPPVLYALASTIAEDDPEDAIFWYHVGRLRATYDALRARDPTSRNAVIELRKLLSLPLRQSLFYKRDLALELAKKAVAWDRANPRDYDQRWVVLYGKVAATSDGADERVFVPEDEWPAILKHVHEAHLQSVEDFAEEKPR